MPTEQLDVIVKVTDKGSKDIGKLNKSLKGLGDTAKTVAKIIAGIGVVVGGIAVKEFSQFEKAMSSVKAITNSTGEDFEQLNKLAKEMGATTAFTAKEAAEGMKFLGMAGFETTEIMDSLQGTLNLAAAGSLGLGEAADIASNILTGFQKEASEMNSVVDVLAKTVTSSNTDIIQMGDAMKFLAPTAAALKIPIEEAAAVVGILGNAGLQGGIATRSFSASLIKLADPTNKMKAAMDELGVSFFDSNGQFIGINETIRILEDSMEGMTDQQRQASLAAIFGTGSMKQLNSLMAAGSDELTRYTKELENSTGAAQKMADVQLDNLAGSFTLLKSAVSGLAISVGSELAPELRTIIDTFTGLITELNESGKAVQIVSNFITLMKVIFKGIKIVIDTVIKAYQNIKEIVESFGVTMTDVAKIVSAFIFPVKTVIFWLADMFGTLDEQGKQSIKDFISRLIEIKDTIKTKVKDGFDSFNKFIENNKEELTVLKDTIRDAGISGFDFLRDKINEGLEKFKELDEQYDITGNIIKGFTALIDGIKFSFEFLWDIFSVFIDALFPGLKEGFGDATEEGLNMTDFFESLKNVLLIVKPILELIAFVVGKTLGGAFNILGDIINFVLLLFNKLTRVLKKIKLPKFITEGSSKLKRLLGFADGGIVPEGFAVGGIVPKIQGFAKGGIASSDTVPAMLTPGEVILNAAQQQNVANQLGSKPIVVNVRNFIGDKQFAMKVGDIISRQLGLGTAIV